MADFTLATTQFNIGSDAAPTWTGTAMNMGGAAGLHEARWQRAGGAGIATTPSAGWPFILKPGSGTQAVEEMWIFTTSDNSGGYKCATYDGGKTNSLVARMSFDNLATPATVMQLSAFADTSDPTPAPGTQTPNDTDGSNIINGSVDTTNKAYLKGNMFGSGYPTGGAQETPVDASIDATTLLVTSGAAGAVSPGAAAYCANWQSLQGWTQYLQAPSIAKPLQAFYLYFSVALFVGAAMETGTFVFVPWAVQYTWT